MRKSNIARPLVGLVAAMVIVESVARVSGAVDFPLYTADDGIGYAIAPSQSGAFLRTHTWAFNAREMGEPEAWTPAKPNLLIIGNSIVMGGNAYAQQEKLGALVAANLKQPGWTAATG